MELRPDGLVLRIYDVQTGQKKSSKGRYVTFFKEYKK